jgi:hypothetical protein
MTRYPSSALQWAQDAVGLYDRECSHTPAKRRRLEDQYGLESPAQFNSATASYTYQTSEEIAFASAHTQIVSNYHGRQQPTVVDRPFYDTTSDTWQLDGIWDSQNSAPSAPVGYANLAFPLQQHSESTSHDSNLIRATSENRHTCGYYQSSSSSVVRCSMQTVSAPRTEAEQVCFGMASELIVLILIYADSSHRSLSYERKSTGS